MKNKKNISKDEMLDIWNKAGLKIAFPKNNEKRVVDLYDRKAVEPHMQRFAQHCAAKGIQPTLKVIIDWLYGTKAFNERDDFVKISRLIELVEHDEVYPLLILEVLHYALDVEKAAIGVFDQLGHLSDEFDSLKTLKNVLATRLEVREDDKKKENDASNSENGVKKTLDNIFKGENK